MTIKVFKDVAGFPGLYRWDYDIRNISVSLDYCGSAGNDLGLGYFDLYFPQEIPDLGNISLPEGWAYLAGSWTVDGRVSSMLKVGTNTGLGVLIGEVLHLSLPDAIVIVASLYSGECCGGDRGWDILLAVDGVQHQVLQPFPAVSVRPQYSLELWQLCRLDIPTAALSR